MATFNNGESGSSVRTKINNVLQHADGTASELVINEAGADVNFRVESDTNANALFVDGGTGNVGIGASSITPIYGRTLQVGDGSITTTVSLLGTGAGTTGDVFLASVGSEAVLGSRAATPLSFATNDVERIRITSTGSVGIGTSSPAATFCSHVLQVAGTADANSEVRLTHTTSGTGSTDGFTMLLTGSEGYLYNRENGSLIFGTNNTERARIDASGNVGIGTSSPAAALHLENTSVAAKRTVRIAFDGTYYAELYQNGIGGLEYKTFGGLPHIWFQGATERMRIDASGNVGIGTSSPSARIEASLASAASGLLGVANSPALVLTNSANYGWSTGMLFKSPLVAGNPSISNAAIWAEWQIDNNAYLGFATTVAGTLAERMRITATGFVGIGTSSPADLLHVKGSTVAVGDYQIIVEGATGGYGAGVSFQTPVTGGPVAEMARITADGEAAWDTTASTQDAGLRFYTALDGTVAERMRIDASGNVGIGTVSPAQKLHVSTAGNNYIVSHNTAGSTSALLLGAESGSTSIYSWTTPAGSTGVPLKFFTGASEAMRIDASGKLLVNTTTASGSSAPLVSRGGITVTDGAATQRGITQEIVTGESGTFTTITVSFDSDSAAGSLIVEILMTGFAGVYLDYVAGLYGDQADVVMRSNASGGTSVALTGDSDSSWTATITTSVTHPVVKVKATAGGLTSAFANAPTVTFA